jgi:AcrR family transcriptional regulator
MRRVEGGVLARVAPWLHTGPVQVKPGLTPDRVVEVAHSILHEAGEDALTVRALSDALGVGTAAIYRLIVSKQLLRIAVADLVMSEVDVEAALRARARRGEPRWVARLRGLALEVRRVLTDHPHSHSVLASELICTPATAAVADVVIGALREGGFAGTELVHAYNTWTGFVFGHTVLEIKPRTAESEELGEGIAGFLDDLDPHVYPNLTSELANLRDRAFSLRTHAGPVGDGHSFDWGLDAVLESLRNESTQTDGQGVRPEGRQTRR